jgi:hypothetical protein
MAEQQPVAVFDIDGTIFRSNLLVEVVDTLVEQGTFPRKIKNQFRREYQAWREHRHRESYVQYIDRLVATYLNYVKGTTTEEMDAAVSAVMDYVPQQLYVLFSWQYLDLLPS